MSKIQASVFIITKNEEQHIERALKSCQEFDEILLVDSGSSDRTVAIAESLGAKIIVREWPGFAKQKQFAMEQCQHEWVLNLDADEELTPELIKAFVEVIENNAADYVKCYRNDIYMGEFFSPLSHKPNNHRLFKKQSAQYRTNDLVHEGPDFTGKEVVIKKSFNHYGYFDIKTLNEKFDSYSSLKSKEKFDKGKKYSLLKLMLIFPLTFIKFYFLKRFLFSGIRGFIYSVQESFYAFQKEAKLFQHWKLKKVAKNND